MWSICHRDVASFQVKQARKPDDKWHCVLSLCRAQRDDDDDVSVGRPSLSVDMYEVEFLRSLGFTWTDIARCLDVSRSTLYRRLDESSLPLQGYTDIPDATLDSLVRELKLSHPNDGEVMMAAHVRARGIHVTRSRLRASIHRVDSMAGIRRHPPIRRRVYHVEAPNSLWHIDGNHKLIRWRFVIHGAIDGYSRVVLYLRCETNNRASTVLSLYTKAVDIFGLPDRVRSDRGGENVDVWQFMCEQHSMMLLVWLLAVPPTTKESSVYGVMYVVVCCNHLQRHLDV